MPSQPVDAASEELQRERRRVPRLQLTHEQFRLDANGKIFSVLDLSLGGLGLRILDEADHIHFTVGSSFAGTLKLRAGKAKVRAVARHVRKDHVGAEFEALPEESARILEDSLDPAKIGAAMRPLPCPDARATWYHGPSGADLLVWRGADGTRTRMGLFLLGNFIQWEEIEGLSTGMAAVGEEPIAGRGVIGFETLVLERDGRPDPEKLRLARALFSKIACPGELKNWCLRKVSGQ